MSSIRRPSTIAFDRPCVLIEPGVEVETGALGSALRRAADVEHAGLRCNYRPTRGTEREESGSLIVAETEATLMFRWSPLTARIATDWIARVDGLDYELTTPPQLMGRRKYVRLNVRRRQG